MTRNRTTALLGIGTVVAGVLVAAVPASAATVDGVIGIKGPGSVYAGTDLPHQAEAAIVTKPTKAGVAASFGAEVLNKGSELAQFRVTLSDDDVGAFVQLFVGSTDVTSLARGPGFVTTPLATAKFQVLTLKITPPVGAQPADAYFGYLHLSSIDGAQALGGVDAGATIASTVAGTTDHDILATASGQPTIRGMDLTHGNSFIDTMTAATLKVGGTATYTLTLKNDSTDTTQMLVNLDTGFGCAAAGSVWSLHLKVGTSDITFTAVNSTWISPPTLPGKSLKLILTAKALSLPSAAGCINWLLPTVTVHGLDPTFEEVFLAANVV